MSKSEKWRRKMAGMAKDREEFEQQKKAIALDMKNMSKLEEFHGEDMLRVVTEDGHEETNMVIRRTTSKGGFSRNNSGGSHVNAFRRITTSSTENKYEGNGNSGSDKSLEGRIRLPVPSGRKISDWCYSAPFESSPPVIKGQQDLYVDVRFLGRGAFGTVDLIKNKEDNKLYAVKTMLVAKKSDQEEFLHEVKFLRNRHPFIIHLHDAFITNQPKKIYLVMHYCEGGDLGKVITMTEKGHNIVPEVSIFKWIAQISLAVDFLHGLRIVHRDIKPQNILLSNSGEVAQLADFGLATELPENEEHFKSEEVGTPLYTAPEMIKAEPCSFPVDIWSLGCVLFELMALRLPYDGVDTMSLVKSILGDDLNLDLIPKDTYSPDLVHVAEGSLQKDPLARVNTVQILTHPGIVARTASLPSAFRPKYLEERLRRAYVKQMHQQLDGIGVHVPTANSSSSSTPLHSPAHSRHARFSNNSIPTVLSPSSPISPRCDIPIVPPKKKEPRKSGSVTSNSETSQKHVTSPPRHSSTSNKKKLSVATTEKQDMLELNASSKQMCERKPVLSPSKAAGLKTADAHSEKYGSIRTISSAKEVVVTDSCADRNTHNMTIPTLMQKDAIENGQVDKVIKDESNDFITKVVKDDDDNDGNVKIDCNGNIDGITIDKFVLQKGTMEKPAEKFTEESSGLRMQIATIHISEGSTTSHEGQELSISGVSKGSKFHKNDSKKDDNVIVLPRIMMEKDSSSDEAEDERHCVKSAPQLPQLPSIEKKGVCGRDTTLMSTKSPRKRIRRHSAHPLELARNVMSVLPFQDRRCNSGTTRPVTITFTEGSSYNPAKNEKSSEKLSSKPTPRSQN